MPRLFFGLTLTDACRAAVGRIQDQLRQRGVEAGNWSRPDQFHVTVSFLGELPDAEIPRLAAAGKAAASQVSTFEIHLCTVGTFPKNRVLWLGANRDRGYERLLALHQALNRQLSAAAIPGLSLEARPYQPHLTLARKLNLERWRQAAAAWNERFDVHLPVGALCLFASTRQAERLVYPVLERYPLLGKADE
ncbi:RNA 2',3'-cyclic phosphodiesterase [Alicyclobacillus contaminans]|uniref:RNA 2',3'-cyclic phosphodiesterase n=1 Tax=Alicyclobacillus contaminans TaxID=392016 RepID=UPI000406E204|nr:RNA 2',3'-cyclic phosphodiesterase [Alicyclobacillus contaminans]GMA49452.1 RNA 2',3'-cyclic phosphodiesterase [Alicyclobacillus contaminans]